MTKVEGICLGDSPAGAQVQPAPVESRFADKHPNGIAMNAGNKEITATLPHWEHFLKSRFQRAAEIPA